MVVEWAIRGWLGLDVDPDTVLNLKFACSSLDPRADSSAVVCHKAAALGSGDLVESHSCPFLAIQPCVSHFSPLSLSGLRSGVDLKGSSEDSWRTVDLTYKL